MQMVNISSQDDECLKTQFNESVFPLKTSQENLNLTSILQTKLAQKAKLNQRLKIF